MPSGLAPIDYAVFGASLVAFLAVGAWVARGRPSGDEFLAAGRAMTWGPLALSLAVAGPAVLYYAGLANEVHGVGLRVLLIPALVWLAVPLVLWCLVPLYYNLAADSIYEYLELRFSLAVRIAGAAMFLVWSLLWLGCVLALPCKAMGLWTGSPTTAILVLLATGSAATIITLLGGAKAAIRTHVLQCVVVAAGLVVVVLAVRGRFEGQVERIWDTARELGRDRVVDISWNGASNWSVWSAGPFLVLLPLFFFAADQATAGRLLAARHYRDANRSVLLGTLLFCLAVPAVTYTGLGLLAMYHVHAQEEMRPNWVVHSSVDPDTRRDAIDNRTVLDEETVRDLIADRAILDPNLGSSTDPTANRPIRDIEGLVDSEGRVVIDRIATWDSRPHPSRPRKRIWQRRLRRGHDELFAWFVHRHVGPGWAGLVLAGLAAAAMAALDSGLAAMAGVLVVDFHRRLGWAEGWLARRCGKSPDDLDEGDELRLARPLVLVLGLSIALLAMAALQIDNLFEFMVLLVSLPAGPLLGVFLLGLFTRRTTAPAALGALAVGASVSLWLVLGHYLAGTAALGWAWQRPPGIFWPLPLGTAATVVAGYLLGHVVGRRKNRTELTGLVVGLGTWGVIVDADAQQERIALPHQEEITWLDGEEDQEQGPWR